MKSFQISHSSLFEMVDKLFADTVVICHHEKLFTSALFLLFIKSLNLLLQYTMYYNAKKFTVMTPYHKE